MLLRKIVVVCVLVIGCASVLVGCSGGQGGGAPAGGTGGE